MLRIVSWEMVGSPFLILGGEVGPIGSIRYFVEKEYPLCYDTFILIYCYVYLEAEHGTSSLGGIRHVCYPRRLL